MNSAPIPACPVTADRSGRDSQGFTLLEIVIVMVIISVLAVMAMPVVSSMMREAAMREPVERLEELAKAVRLRAMLEGYPYEIIFTAEGFEGRRFQLRREGEESVEDEELEEAEKEAEAANEEHPADPETDPNAELTGEDGEEKEPTLVLPELEAYQFSGPMACRLLFWGRTRWMEPPQPNEKEQTPVHNRWLFQPSGLCNPLTVQFYRDDMWVEIAFNPLTADIQSERSLIPE